MNALIVFESFKGNALVCTAYLLRRLLAKCSSLDGGL